MSKKPGVKRKPSAFRRATFYLRPDQIRNLKICAALLERQLSDVMRDAVGRAGRDPLREVAGDGAGRWGPSSPSRPVVFRPC